jgi:hypothetical protein
MVKSSHPSNIRNNPTSLQTWHISLFAQIYLLYFVFLLLLIFTPNPLASTQRLLWLLPLLAPNLLWPSSTCINENYVTNYFPEQVLLLGYLFLKLKALWSLKTSELLAQQNHSGKLKPLMNLQVSLKWGICAAEQLMVAPQHAFLQRGSKAICPMSQICGMLKNPAIYTEVGIAGQIDQPFLAHTSVLH